MIQVARQGAPKQLLDNRDIRILGSHADRPQSRESV